MVYALLRLVYFFSKIYLNIRKIQRISFQIIATHFLLPWQEFDAMNESLGFLILFELLNCLLITTSLPESLESPSLSNKKIILIKKEIEK